MKIAVIGGGSTYTPELIDGLADKVSSLSIREVCLYDIDSERLDVVAGFCRRLLSYRGADPILTTTGSLPRAVDGADFVLLQIRVGGQHARHRDITLGLKHGLIGQETTGIGGFAKALRTLPVVMEICRAVETYAPRSWVLNFTNPSGLVTEAILNHTSVKALGLCNIPMDMKMSIALETGIAPDRIRLDTVGLNHLGWVRRILVDDRDILPEVVGTILKNGTPKNIPDIDYDPVLLRSLGMIPMYYLRYYYYPEKMLGLLRAMPKTRAQEVMEIEARLLELYKDENQHEKPALLDQRGGAYYSRVALDLIEALQRPEQSEHIVNLANGGSTDTLPPTAVIECPALINASGAFPLPIGPVDPKIRGLMQAVKAYEELTIRAALNRDYNAAFWALAGHPLGPTAERTKAILDELIEINGLHDLKP